MLIILIFVQTALPQRGGEVNLTLGGIDLNNSGRYAWQPHFVCTGILNNVSDICASLSCSVVVREDKKLLTVLFPDGRDGRAFTLKVSHLLIKVFNIVCTFYVWNFLTLMNIFFFFPFFLAFRPRHQKIYMSGKQPWNMLLHKRQVRPLSWDIMGFFVMMQMIQLKDLSINVLSVFTLNFLLIGVHSVAIWFLCCFSYL